MSASTRPVPIVVWGTAVLLPSRRGGKERKRHHFIYIYSYYIRLVYLLKNVRCKNSFVGGVVLPTKFSITNI